MPGFGPSLKKLTGRGESLRGRNPLYTINGEHYVSELIETCGGRNVFADLGDLAPMIGIDDRPGMPAELLPLDVA